MATETIEIAVGADHGGFELKQQILQFLQQQGFSVDDCGTNSKEAVDYPKYASAVARKVSTGECRFGIMIDGAGIGSAMTANRFSGVRAAQCYNEALAKNAREHNDANFLSLGSGQTDFETASKIIEIFLNTNCTEERHLRRVSLINALDCRENPNTILKEDKLPELSQQDILKIAEKVGSLLQNTKPAETAAPTCTDGMVCVCGTCVDKKPDTMRQFLDFGVERLGYHDASGGECVPDDIARCIDHTLLKPDATEQDVVKLCTEARQYNFATVCVSPSYVALAAKELAGSPVKVCTVVGFPSGAHRPEIKAMETRQAIRDGATEIDMVINIGALKSGNDELVYRDIRMVCEACEDGSATSKVIIEAALLNDDEKIRACTLSKKARANFVKTSTGFGPGGATAEDVALMRKVVGEGAIGVKAAGGIRSYEDAQKMITAGANRIGASASIKILQQAKSVTISN